MKTEDTTIKIDENKKCVEIFVNPGIFPVDCIRRALDDFTGKTTASMTERGNMMIVALTPPAAEIKHLKGRKQIITYLKKLGYDFNTRLVASFVESI